MPFDATNYADNEVSASGVEVGKLRRLSEALKREMPKGFVWDFRHIDAPHPCGTAGCAIGLAITMGMSPYESTVAHFGLDEPSWDATFCYFRPYGVSRMPDVTPQMVAAAIDRIIARETA